MLAATVLLFSLCQPLTGWQVLNLMDLLASVTHRCSCMVLQNPGKSQMMRQNLRCLDRCVEIEFQAQFHVHLAVRLGANTLFACTALEREFERRRMFHVLQIDALIEAVENDPITRPLENPAIFDNWQVSYVSTAQATKQKGQREQCFTHTSLSPSTSGTCMPS
jgi:hypothetical protein